MQTSGVSAELPSFQVQQGLWSCGEIQSPELLGELTVRPYVEQLEISQNSLLHSMNGRLAFNSRHRV